MICPFSISGKGSESKNLRSVPHLSPANTLIIYKMINTLVVIMEPFKPNCSSDKGWARMFPIIKAIMKSSNLNCEMDRCPINFTERSKKKNEIMALKIHWIAVRVSWLLKKSTKIHVLISNRGDVMGSLFKDHFSWGRL